MRAGGGRRVRIFSMFALSLGLGACASSATLPLRSVVLYQNGLGYFERSGALRGDRLRLRLRANEVDDILKSLTVLGSGERTTLGTVAALRPRGKEGSGDHELELTLPPGASHALRVTYAAPTPVWRAAYRVVLDEKSEGALLQGWAIVANPSDEDWRAVQLTLATGSPLSFMVDLHTPQYVTRPDVTRHFLQPGATGVVASESARSTAADVQDSDGDGIPDSLDKCPGEPETFNGYEDQDGCPDKGRVIVRTGKLEVLDKIYFGTNQSEIKPISRPILDAIAATLKGNPQITLLEIGGNAAENEREPLGLSSQRATAVVSYLVGKGVERGRLKTHSYGASKPARAGSDEEARSINRRVEFLILRRSDGPADRDDEPAPPQPTLGALERSVEAAPAIRVDVAGMSRYQIATPVSIPRGTSGMIAILNQRVIGQEVYLYRPEPAAPGSTLHPFRAARVVGPTATTLEAGPVTIYARSTFVGDGILERLHAGETTFLPFAVDSSTVVHSDTADKSAPVRLIAIAKGVVTIEDREAHRTSYEIRAGADAPRHIYLRHARREGYDIDALPAGTQQTADAALIPCELRAGQTSTLVVDEHRPTHREVRLLEPGDTDLRVYASASTLPAPLKKALEEVLAMRREQGELEAQETSLRKRVEDAAERQGQLRESLGAIAKNPRAESLRKELLGRLTEAVRTGEELSQKLARVTTDLAERRTRVEDRVRDLTLAP